MAASVETGAMDITGNKDGMVATDMAEEGEPMLLVKSITANGEQ